MICKKKLVNYEGHKGKIDLKRLCYEETTDTTPFHLGT